MLGRTPTATALQDMGAGMEPGMTAVDTAMNLRHTQPAQSAMGRVARAVAERQHGFKLQKYKAKQTQKTEKNKIKKIQKMMKKKTIK